MRRNELIFVTEGGEVDKCRVNPVPTTEDIHRFRGASERWAIQLVGKLHEVYDCRTLRNQFGTWVIGTPVFVHEDEDAAVMWAMMRGAG